MPTERGCIIIVIATAVIEKSESKDRTTHARMCVYAYACVAGFEGITISRILSFESSRWFEKAKGNGDFGVLFKYLMFFGRVPVHIIMQPDPTVGFRSMGNI